MQTTVLVADDDPLLVAVVEHHLNTAGLASFSVNTGAAAIEMIRKRVPDIVVLDAMMPSMGGIEVLRHMLREGRFVRTKAIMLTTLSDEQTAVSALTLGASDFVAKPFSPEELVLRVRRLANARAA